MRISDWSSDVCSSDLDFYAMVYGMPLAMANFAGEQNGIRFWGGSRVLDPYGNLLAQAGEGEELIFADLDFQAVLAARYHLPTLRAANHALVPPDFRGSDTRRRGKDVCGTWSTWGCA